MEIRKICRELADQGKPLFINSHILADIEMVCDRVVLMKQAGFIDVGTVAEFTSGGETCEVTVAADDGLTGFQAQDLAYTPKTVGSMCRSPTGVSPSAHRCPDSPWQKSDGSRYGGVAPAARRRADCDAGTSLRRGNNADGVTPP